MVALDVEQKYKSYLQTISFIAFLSASIEFVYWVIFHRHQAEKLNAMAIASMIGLVLAGFLGVFIASQLEIYEPLDNFINNLNKGRCVTVLFFVHLICISVFVIQDGGARSSCITNVLLLDASFGYFFAEKKVIKRLVTFLCILAYLLCLIISWNSTKEGFEIHLSGDIFPSLFVVLFVLGVNAIINHQIVGAQKKQG